NCAAKTEFQTKMESVLKENDYLLKHALAVDIRDNVSSSESDQTFAELFETNELKAQIQEKDTVILKLKEKIKSLRADDKERIKERVALVSSASGSQSKDNTKKNKIRRTLKKAKETELEDHTRKVKSSLNKASVVDSRASSSVIKSVSNVNSNMKCASCNGCLFSDNHDKCVVEYINSVNANRKSKSAKKPVDRKVWKTIGKVFKTVGYKWTPTGWIFTLVRNVCPLTRIATAPIVPPREPWGSSSNVSTSTTDCRLSKSSYGSWTPVAPST
nr:hypothetical protein [Tanacetum cinerariifolium]